MIETPRLVLRPWRDGDREPFWEMACDAEVMRYLMKLDRVASDARIDDMIVMQDEHGHCFWAVERREDGRFLGFCGVVVPREPIWEYEIGWRLSRDAWGQGYAREAAQASLDWSWDHIDAPSIMAITNIENTRSWGLMERLGMTRYPEEDFDHPAVPEGDPLRPHILYRIHRPQ
jgi:RimJ/RimL family protein N-acetyltransferase